MTVELQSPSACTKRVAVMPRLKSLRKALTPRVKVWLEIDGNHAFGHGLCVIALFCDGHVQSMVQSELNARLFYTKGP
jgi:prepilin-type processing-associated H-X9-DG protein